MNAVIGELYAFIGTVDNPCIDETHYVPMHGLYITRIERASRAEPIVINGPAKTATVADLAGRFFGAALFVAR